MYCLVRLVSDSNWSLPFPTLLLWTCLMQNSEVCCFAIRAYSWHWSQTMNDGVSPPPARLFPDSKRAIHSWRTSWTWTLDHTESMVIFTLLLYPKISTCHVGIPMKYLLGPKRTHEIHGGFKPSTNMACDNNPNKMKEFLRFPVAGPGWYVTWMVPWRVARVGPLETAEILGMVIWHCNYVGILIWLVVSTHLKNIWNHHLIV